MLPRGLVDSCLGVLILPQNEPFHPTCRVSVVFGEQADFKQFGDGKGQPDDKSTRDENGKKFDHETIIGTGWGRVRGRVDGSAGGQIRNSSM
jgi:hypothetical protein